MNLREIKIEDLHDIEVIKNINFSYQIIESISLFGEYVT